MDIIKINSGIRILLKPNYVSAAYAAARMGLSFSNHGNLTEFMETRHLNMGTRCGNRNVVSKMVKMIYETMLKDVTDMINRNNHPLTLVRNIWFSSRLVLSK